MLATRARVGILVGLAAVVATSSAVALREPAPRTLTAEDVLAACRAARGGSALDRIRATHIVAELAYENGETALETLDVAGSRLQMVVVWPAFGVDYILDGHAGTVVVDQGRIGGERDRRFVTGTERIQTIIDATLGDESMYTSVKLLGTTLFEGTPAYTIERTLVSGATRRIYISQATFLPIGTERDVTRERTKWESAGEPIVQTNRSVFSDYREVSGVMVPFAAKDTSGDPETSATSRVLSYQIELVP